MFSKFSTDSNEAAKCISSLVFQPTAAKEIPNKLLIQGTLFICWGGPSSRKINTYKTRSQWLPECLKIMKV